ncbi:iron-sulfur cluster assembly protein [Algihabitans albus]|uniref:iron-sulfur cluster assembly protein n=1 Tax=Algihabitans albus TaxID=2164067 RepID=UPI002E26C8EB
MTQEIETKDTKERPEPLEPLAQPHYNPYLWPGAMQDDDAAEEGATTTAGEPKPEGEAVAEEEAVVEALRTVYDPEIPVNIFDLGLIYENKINQENGDVAILMTLTAPSCPVAGILPGQVAEKVASVPGTGEVAVTITWDPPWNQTKMSEDAKLALGLF